MAAACLAPCEKGGKLERKVKRATRFKRRTTRVVKLFLPPPPPSPNPSDSFCCCVAYGCNSRKATKKRGEIEKGLFLLLPHTWAPPQKQPRGQNFGH